MKITILKKICYIILVVGLMSIAMPAHAKVSKAEAERLKKDLTPFGAERAGNAEGTIPAWEGGMTSIPKNVKWDPTSGALRPDPFADEKPLYIVTAQNMEEHKDKLSPGVQQLFKKYPETFQIHVYPTHRTQAAPQWVYENTYQNALRAEVKHENSITGAYAGVAFPIPNLDSPEAGFQLLINHVTTWKGGTYNQIQTDYIVEEAGATKMSTAKWNFDFPYYFQEGSVDKFKGYYGALFYEVTYPPASRGNIGLIQTPLDYVTGERLSWTYMVGFRRVRRSPDAKYDYVSQSGLACIDDNLNWDGPADRFDWRFLEKKEMLIPYHNYQLDLVTDVDDMLTPNHVNPKYLRWELHRVWVYEGTLKEGKRHAYGRRVFYADEDTWTNMIQDKYDTRGTLWRCQLLSSIMCYDVPCQFPRTQTHYDFQVPRYAFGYGINNTEDAITFTVNPKEWFTPKYLRIRGRR